MLGGLINGIENEGLIRRAGLLPTSFKETAPNKLHSLFLMGKGSNLKSYPPAMKEL